ncbi:hypothetical protein [Rhodoferax lithotrophicus]|uniref:hypothetical protein n=1 Tax=Rhodoferax lithotrophicus TaxID=2798804 RepID=UPI001CC3B3BA|nr:hypothetical protein [Rhodoferax sp. MIZ03]
MIKVAEQGGIFTVFFNGFFYEIQGIGFKGISGTKQQNPAVILIQFQKLIILNLQNMVTFSDLLIQTGQG